MKRCRTRPSLSRIVVNTSFLHHQNHLLCDSLGSPQLEASKTLHEANVEELKGAFEEEKVTIATDFDTASSKIKEELKNMEKDLTDTQTREFELKQKCEDMQEQISSAEAMGYELKNKLEDVTEQLETGELACNAARHAADEANSKNFELNKIVKKLEVEIEKLQSSSAASSEGDNEVVLKLKEEMEAKDKRIKKVRR